MIETIEPGYAFERSLSSRQSQDSVSNQSESRKKRVNVRSRSRSSSSSSMDRDEVQRRVEKNVADRRAHHRDERPNVRKVVDPGDA